MSTPSGPGHADFAERVGTDFVLCLPDGDHAPLVLTECTARGPGAFSVTFKAGPGAPADQAIYQVSADGFGPEPVFLVPVARRPNDSEYPLEYQAIFNSPLLPVRRPDPTNSIQRLEEESR